MPLLTVSDLDSAVEAHVRVTGMEVIMNHGWIATLAPPTDHSVQISLISSVANGWLTLIADDELLEQFFQETHTQ